DHLQDWKQGATPRRAALNSIGIGGTNSHAIFEEYDEAIDASKSSPLSDFSGPYIVPLSAREQSNLKQYAEDLLHFLLRMQKGRLSVIAGAQPPLRLQDLAYTLQVGRVPMACRAVFLAHEFDELIEQLELFARGEESKCYFTGSAL